MGMFPPSCGKKYFLVAIDYVSKWAKIIVRPAIDARSWRNSLKG